MVIEAETARVRRDDGGVQVLTRAAVLRLPAADSSDGLMLSEPAARSGLPRTTARRTRGALEHEDLVAADTATGRSPPGPGVMRPAMAGRDLPAAVRPCLERLSRELDETVDLGVLDGGAASTAVQMPTARLDEDADTVAGALLRVLAEGQIALRSA